MIGIVVSGHINFASGMASAVRAIAGDAENIAYVDFIESMSTDELENTLRLAAKSVDAGEGVLFLTDVPGGSPSNRASAILMDEPAYEMLAGANLPMIANAIFERDGVNIPELMDILLDIGHASLQDMRKELNAAMQSQPELECEDGL